MNQKYELMTIYKLQSGEPGARELSKSISTLITTLEGKVEKAEFWGKRKFAYEIDHTLEGFYDLIHFEMDSSKLEKFTSKLGLLPNIVRYLITAKAAK